MPSKTWDISIEDEHYYIKLEDKKVIFGNIFDGGKTIIENKCSPDDFLYGGDNMNYKIREIFGG